MGKSFTSGDVLVKETVKFKKPKNYKIVIFNDDRTLMDYVIMLLVLVFEKTPEESEKLMLQVHHEGSAIVGIYSKGKATQLLEEATEFKKTFNEICKKAGKTYFAYLKIRMEEE